MESSDNIVMDKVNNQSMKLYYGDIIKVISTNNPTFNEKIFFVKYVDDMKITLIEKTSFESYTLGLENDIIMDESIERIYLAYRQKDRGVCRVNGYVPGKVIEIHFMRSVKTIVTGRIVNLEEDMIELKIINPGSELHDKTIFIEHQKALKNRRTGDDEQEKEKSNDDKRDKVGVLEVDTSRIVSV